MSEAAAAAVTVHRCSGHEVTVVVVAVLRFFFEKRCSVLGANPDGPFVGLAVLFSFLCLCW